MFESLVKLYAEASKDQAKKGRRNTPDYITEGYRVATGAKSGSTEVYLMPGNTDGIVMIPTLWARFA